MKKTMLVLASVGVFASQASFAAAERTGEAVFKASCNMCHGAGIAGAPKFGDKAAWKAYCSGNAYLIYQCFKRYSCNAS